MDELPGYARSTRDCAELINREPFVVRGIASLPLAAVSTGLFAEQRRASRPSTIIGSSAKPCGSRVGELGRFLPVGKADQAPHACYASRMLV